MENAAFTARIEGRVQGVFFRAGTKREAKRLGIRGWVKNEQDGGVSVYAEGELDALREMEKILSKGPTPESSVRKIEIKWQKYEGNHKTFEIKED